MIQCYIDGKLAVPTLKDSIKLVRENPYIKEKDSYTFDVSFPLDIPQNRAVFGALNRLDTTKRVRKFNNCILTADNVTVVRGIGTVTEISGNEVKLQILGGASSVRYRSDFEQIYIDRISYPTVPQKYQRNCVRTRGAMSSLIDVDAEIRNNGYIGDVNTAVFMPVCDESNDCIANEISVISAISQAAVDGRLYLFNRAVQPNFMLVLRKVLEHMGYTISTNEYDVSPWNELVICSARQTAIIAKALPHWTVKKFLDEFRKLFNATFLFDESTKTVAIVRGDSAADALTVSYEAADGMTTSYDEDGLEYLGSSNIRYNLSNLGEKTWEVPDDVLQNFDIQEYDSTNSMITAFNAMSEEQKLTTLMIDPQGFVYATEEKDDDGNRTGNIGLKRFGEFTKLIRNSSSDNDVSLSICPVAMEYRQISWKWLQHTNNNYIDMSRRRMTGYNWIPVINNSSIEVKDDSSQDEEERPYVTIEEVVEAGESATREEEEEDVTIELMWATKTALKPVDGDNRMPIPIPLCDVDWRFCPVESGRSLALTHAGSNPYIGRYHERFLQVNTGSNIDSNDEVCIPFFCDGIPDPSNIYMFYGKRYLCSKIEINITQDGIDSLKKGYFYEIL